MRQPARGARPRFDVCGITCSDVHFCAHTDSLSLTLAKISPSAFPPRPDRNSHTSCSLALDACALWLGIPPLVYQEPFGSRSTGAYWRAISSPHAIRMRCADQTNKRQNLIRHNWCVPARAHGRAAAAARARRAGSGVKGQKSSTRIRATTKEQEQGASQEAGTRRLRGKGD